jgi:hypothetical protein
MAETAATYVDAHKVAQALNITIQRVGQLVSEGMPKEGRGRYNLGACMLWYIRYLQKALERRAVPTSDGAYTGLGDAKVRVVKADAELKELELAKQRRELIAAPDIERRWTDIVAVVKARLLAIGGRITPLLIGETDRTAIQTRIDDAVKDALAEMANAKGVPQ